MELPFRWVDAPGRHLEICLYMYEVCLCFKSNIQIECNGTSIDGKSMMQVSMLWGLSCGCWLADNICIFKVKISGDDEKIAENGLKDFSQLQLDFTESTGYSPEYEDKFIELIAKYSHDHPLY